MKDIIVKSLGVTFKLHGVPETNDEFDQLAKEKNAATREAVNNVSYRSSYPEFREKLVEQLEELTEVKRATKPSRAAKEGEAASDVPTTFDERESEYINRLVNVEKVITLADVQKAADAIAITFDPTKAVRESQLKKPSAAQEKAARDVVAAGKGDRDRGALQLVHR